MEQFKRVLGIILGIAALVMLAALVVVTLNQYADLNFISGDTRVLIENIVIFYALPAIVGLAAVYYVSDKNLLIFILTVIFVAAALFIYYAQDAFFEFIDGIVR